MKVLAISTLCAFVILSAVMQSTTPSSIHPIGILFVFVLLYMLALGVLTFFVYLSNKLAIKISRKRANLLPMSVGRACIYASVLSLAFIMIVGMASIGRTRFYEVMLVIIFEIAACFYVAKQR